MSTSVARSGTLPPIKEEEEEKEHAGDHTTDAPTTTAQSTAASLTTDHRSYQSTSEAGAQAERLNPPPDAHLPEARTVHFQEDDLEITPAPPLPGSDLSREMEMMHLDVETGQGPTGRGRRRMRPMQSLGDFGPGEGQDVNARRQDRVAAIATYGVLGTVGTGLLTLIVHAAVTDPGRQSDHNSGGQGE